MQPNNNTLLQNINNNHNNKKTNNNNKNNNNNSNNTTNTTTTSSGNHHHRSHGSTAQACAACKYQRRKCAADCILAPYFPHDRQRQFLNAHRLFGVSNIVKIVRHLDPVAKDHAMRTIIFQSDARAADPVGGCHRIIRDLEYQIGLAKAELDVVLHHLALCRRHAAADEVVVIDDVNSSWSTCMHGENVNNNTSNNESMTSSTYVHHHDDHHINHHHHMMKSLSMEDCNQMKSILDHLSSDDDDTRQDHHRYNFDSHGNILTSNGILTEESDRFKDDDDGPFSFIQA
ncbi:hypothetical protein CASFOL_038551 [Castilleja foliolosa]|uniref:LOB domain-containing protein n=1 Tax=Castilleja foliolosa TaxID=1961234 RepID=A0ABD3BLC9_9LAMI